MHAHYSINNGVAIISNLINVCERVTNNNKDAPNTSLLRDLVESQSKVIED